MKLIIGFFMAWGNFLTLPCPFKRWDGKLKNIMLSFLPLIGGIIGGLWIVLFEILKVLGIDNRLSAFIMVFYIFAICGFMHMDGFMDCNDAILSRRPLEDRQRILKDSTVGAFAVVTIVFLLLAFLTAMNVAIEKIGYIDIFLIPIFSRSISGASILLCKPIGHSQYVNNFKEEKKGRYLGAIAIQDVLALLLVIFVFGNWKGALIAGIICAISTFLACAYARKNLGGMSGDIAGYSICLGEVAGIIALAII